MYFDFNQGRRNSKNRTYHRNDRVACEICVSSSPQEFARHPYLSLRFSDYLFTLFRPESFERDERYHHRYWRSTRESSDSFHRVRNNLLNYRMPKVTSTRREAREGNGEKDYRREGLVGVMVQIGRMGDSP